MNIVTKTPQPDRFLTVDLTGGVPGYGRIGIDANTGITRNLDARLNIAATDERQLQAFRDVTEQFVSPSLRWRPTNKLSFLVEGNYLAILYLSNPAWR